MVIMLKKIKDWARITLTTGVFAARKHFIITLGTVAAAAFSLGAGAVSKYYEHKMIQIENMKVDDFKEIVSSNDKFLELLSTFTEEVANSGKADQNKKREISLALTKYYTKIGNFSNDIPADKEVYLKALQSSINEVKKRVQLVNTIDDLDPLSIAFLDLLQNEKIAKPVFEEAIGKKSAAKAA